MKTRQRKSKQNYHINEVIFLSENVLFIIRIYLLSFYGF